MKNCDIRNNIIIGDEQRVLLILFLNKEISPRMINHIEDLEPSGKRHQRRQSEGHKDLRAVTDCGSNQMEYEKSYSPNAIKGSNLEEHADLDGEVAEPSSPPTVNFKNSSQLEEKEQSVSKPRKKQRKKNSIYNRSSCNRDNFQTSQSDLSELHYQVVDD